MIRVVAKIIKADDRVIKILENNTFKNFRHFDIREYFRDEDGDFLPMRRGVTFRPELLGAIIEGLRRLEKL